MLLDSDRQKLEGLIKEKLGEAQGLFFVTGTLDDGSGSRPEGVLAFGSQKVAFAAQDVLSGEVWKEWPKNGIQNLAVNEELLGAKLTFNAGGSVVALERIPKDQAQELAGLVGGGGSGGSAPASTETTAGAGAAASPPPPASSPPAQEAPQSMGMSFEPVEAPSPPPAQGASRTSQDWVCSSCGKKNKANFEFCLGCGDAYSPGAAASGASGAQEGLLVGLGKHDGEVVALTEKICKVGRHQGAFLTIPSGNLSRLHAVIEGTGPTRTVIDLGSANGTYVNGKPINRANIQDGDRVRFGDDHEFVFKWDNSPAGTSQRPRVSYGAGTSAGAGGGSNTSSSAAVFMVVGIVIAILGAVMAFLLGAT